MKFKHKNIEGFSLVELIVVIVILAILIGVTIVGVYKYTNEARKNTDINNAATIQRVTGVLVTDKDVLNYFLAKSEGTGNYFSRGSYR